MLCLLLIFHQRNAQHLDCEAQDLHYRQIPFHLACMNFLLLMTRVPLMSD